MQLYSIGKISMRQPEWCLMCLIATKSGLVLMLFLCEIYTMHLS